MVHPQADQEDDTFLEVQEKATGEMTKYPTSMLLADENSSSEVVNKELMLS